MLRLLPVLLGLTFAASAQKPRSIARDLLPDSPGALIARDRLFGADDSADPQSTQPASPPHSSQQPPRCGAPVRTPSPEADASDKAAVTAHQSCIPENPVQPIVTEHHGPPLSWQQKGELAFRDTIDPFNLMTIGISSAFDIAINSHSAFGPGPEGWGELSGYTFVEDAQGEFFGTFLIASVTHEDPRYHRLPHATVKRRILHALEHTWVSQHDDGSPMPNYATLLTYPISAELSNLYVPGVPTDMPDTAKRVAIGLSTDPAGTLVAEFLPDLAKRIHVNVIFIQQILNQVATGGTAPNVQ